MIEHHHRKGARGPMPRHNRVFTKSTDKRDKSLKSEAAKALKKLKAAGDSVTVSWLKTQVKKQAEAVTSLLKEPPEYEAHLAAYNLELTRLKSTVRELTRRNEQLKSGIGGNEYPSIDPAHRDLVEQGLRDALVVEGERRHGDPDHFFKPEAPL